MRLDLGPVAFEFAGGDRHLRMHGHAGEHRIPLRGHAVSTLQFSLEQDAMVIRVSEEDRVEIRHRGGYAHFEVHAATTQFFGIGMERIAFHLTDA